MAELLKQSLNRIAPESMTDALRALGFGDVIRNVPTFLRGKKPAALGAASAQQLSTLQALLLPEDAKASVIHRAYARAGVGALGEMTVALPGVTPTAGQCAIGPNGDIVFLGTDAYTSVDVVYTPEKGDVYGVLSSAASVGITLPVVAGVLTLPAAPANAILLMAANALVGTSTGQKTILVPGAGAPAAGQARFNLAKSTITFATADAVTSAIVDVLFASALDVDALLEANSNYI